MHRVLALVGNLLVAVGLGGLVLLVVGPPDALLDLADQATAWSQLVPARARPGRINLAAAEADLEPTPSPSATPAVAPAAAPATPPPVLGLAPIRTPAPVPSPPPTRTPAPTPTPIPRLPITRVQIASIQLDAEAVPAQIVEQDGVKTWEVPAFKAGHADYTAGAGGVGNAVLIGHVSSRRSGDVFKDLDRVEVGDVVQVHSGPRRFTYRVVEVRAVPRDDVSVVKPTTIPTLSLITCTGQWLAQERDFSERLVVRAELVKGEG